ncbi:MAG: efflux RND transporter permease subunit [Planctomycetes bacterium]|nr:efflux RND transporter permease subunit [Planctomycetota bacterium]
MFISDFAVRQRTTVFVLTVILILAGLYSYLILPRESAPEVVIPHVFISTTYRGVSPEDIELSITKEIEDKLKELDNVKKIASNSSEGMSKIDVEFITGTDINDALQKVKDKVDLAKAELPLDLEDDPSVEDFDISEMPILTFALSGESGQKKLRDIGEDLQEKIEGIPGVLEVDVVGGLEREIHIEVDPSRMALSGVSYEVLQGKVKSENANVSGGSVRTGEGKYQIRIEGEFKTAEDVEDIVVMMQGDGKPVYLRDIAVVSDGFKDRNDASRLDGKDSVTLYVKKRSGENILGIVDKVKALVAQEKSNWPADTRITYLEDQSEEIRMMIADLENNIISGLILVILVVCLAMGFRNSVLVSLSIPLSMLLGFVVLQALGVTLNMVVLFSLTLALGMLVDNAIVIIENIFRFMQEGVPRIEAAMRATGEVAGPIIASGLTTIAAFTPLLWWEGIMGEFMSYLPLTVIVVLSTCLFVALVVNPALAAVFMRAKITVNKPRSADEVMSAGEHPMLHGGGLIIGFYRKILRSALGMDIATGVGRSSRWRRYFRRLMPLLPRISVLLLAGLTFILMITFWYYRIGMEKGSEFFPTMDPKHATVTMEMPEGADLKYCDAIVREGEMRIFDKRAQEYVDGVQAISYKEACQPKQYETKRNRSYQSPSDIENIKACSSRVNSLSGSSGGMFATSTNGVTVLFNDLLDRTEKSPEIMERINERVKGMTGCKVTVDIPQEGPPTGAPINIELVGDDLKQLGEAAKKVKKIIAMVPYIRDIQDDFMEGAPTLKIRVNRKRAAFLGLSSGSIGYVLKAAINGIEISTYREGDEDYDIIVRVLESDRHMIETLRRLFISSPTHGQIPLTSIATIEYIGGLGEINRIDHNRVVTIKAEVDEEKTTGITARQQAEKLLEGTPFFTPEKLFAQGKSEEDLKAVELPEEFAGIFQKIEAEASEKRSFLDKWMAAITARFSDDEEKLSQKLIAVKLNNIIRELKYEYHQAAIDAFITKTATAFPPEDEKFAKLKLAQRMVTQMDVNSKERQNFNRMLLNLLYPELLVEKTSGIEMPPGTRYRFTGEFEFEKEASDFLTWAGSVAIALIFLILVSQFNSVLFPFIIISSVVLSLSGVFFGLGICKMPFGIIMTGVGVISLAGVVVNNAIVLIDYTEKLIRRGMARDEAIVTAGATRLRPVLLTAITTILGLIPMATGYSWDFHWETFGPVTESEMAQIWSNMAVAVIFGLGMATMLTLVVVPVLFSLLDDLSQLGLKFFNKLCEWVMGRFERTKNSYWKFVWKITRLQPRPGEPGYKQDL